MARATAVPGWNEPTGVRPIRAATGIVRARCRSSHDSEAEHVRSKNQVLVPVGIGAAPLPSRAGDRDDTEPHTCAQMAGDGLDCGRT